MYNINEHSKNDPIPEITRTNKLCIILLGVPGIGKSTFAKNYILTKNQNIKIFSTDNVSLEFTKNPNQYYYNESKLNIRKLKIFIKTGNSFIYDTTGNQKNNITEITNLSKENDYTIIFIHVMGTKDLSLKQNKERKRNVDINYINTSYQNQFKNMKYFSKLKPDSYYIIYNLDGKYKFLKYDGKLYKRKVDKYVPLKENKIIKFNEFFDFNDDDFVFEEEQEIQIGDIVKCKNDIYHRTTYTDNTGYYTKGESIQTSKMKQIVTEIDYDKHGTKIMKLKRLYPWFKCDEWYIV